MNDNQIDKGLNRRLTGVETFAHSLPVIALVIPLLIAIVVPKTNLTRAVFGGWNAVLFVIVILGGAVWWSRRLLKSEAAARQMSDRDVG